MSWALLLRVARRDALRSKARSLLIVAMVALPVFALSAVDVLARTADVTALEGLPVTHGAADVLLRGEPGGLPLLQDPDGRLSTFDGDGTPRPGAPVDPASVLPRGSRVVRQVDGEVVVADRTGTTRIGIRELPYDDPVLAGVYRQAAGRAPRTAGEVAVTPAALEALGVGVGDRVEVREPAGALTVVGAVHRTDQGPGEEPALVAAPGTLARLGAEVTPHGSQAWADTPGPFTWPQVVAANEKGVTVVSRAVLLDPPPREQVPIYAQHPAAYGTDVADVLAALLVVGLATLEVVLLAGTAFAVGTRRQGRALALLAAAGGESRHVRGVVLAGGAVLGLAGAVLGVLGGTGLALAAIPVIEGTSGDWVGVLDLRPVELLGIAAVGLLTGVLAAVLPARTAARQDVVRALSGRRGTVRTARRVPAVGLAVSALGVGLAALGSAMTLGSFLDAEYGGESSSTGPYVLLAGAALAQVGLIVASPAIVGAAARLARFLPLAPRLALRDAGRHRGRSAPAVAAVMTAVAGSLALTCYVVALDDRDSRSHQFLALPGQATVSLVGHGEPGTGAPEVTRRDPAAVERAVAGVLPVRGSTVVPRVTDDCAETCTVLSVAVPPANACPVAGVLERERRRPTREEVERHRGDWRCGETLGLEAATGISYSSRAAPVGDATLLRAVTGTGSAEAEAALRAGGVVVFDRRHVHAGRATLVTETSDVTGRTHQHRRAVPAALLPVTTPVTDLFLSPAAARQAGVAGEVHPATLLLDLGALPTEGEVEAANDALRVQGFEVRVERGYVSQYGLGLLALVAGSAVITLGAAGIATGLAGADSRPDHATLAAVGAAPRVRRLLAMAQAGTVAGLGTVLGVAVGFVPAAAFLAAIPGLRLIVPWPSVAAILLGVPLLAALAAGTFTRSRLSLDRRVA